ncbi:helix-turn-helix domain-containing protein [Cohnella thailandensis]|uniref:Helix-turn-helix domain-containing protein n=1 Tax=Cohnella thailandensis TaxID=557557 RepID=A0A841SYM8_9BACL|nr:AraC family transcriptional regulator [Cohnella thailandensis]MBB6635726.1 helix-turn-helix domain-containing protein [Cohnella thailandensis]MBP1976102.1 AraC-like DNA-binding protein [Cohnella thailandensis]
MSSILDDQEPPKYYLDGGRISLQRIKRRGATAMPRPHSHESVELYYLLDGERVYFVDGKVITLRKGELIAIAENVIHSTASSEIAEFERVLIHCDLSALPESLQGLKLFEDGEPFRVFALNLREREEAERLLRRMLEECALAKPYYEPCCLSLLAELAILLGRSDRAAASSPRDSLHAKVSEIAEYLQLHYRESLTLADTAKHFYLSSSYLSRVFHRLTGFHFREYILHLRIREAQRLLAHSRKRISDVSLDVGFEHLSHFNKAFKQACGLTPMQYRKKAKSEPSGQTDI